MLGLSPQTKEHKLNVDPSYKLVIQKRRHLGAKHSTVVVEKVKKLLEARFILECQYEWITSVVLVK